MPERKHLSRIPEPFRPSSLGRIQGDLSAELGPRIAKLEKAPYPTEHADVGKKRADPHRARTLTEHSRALQPCRRSKRMSDQAVPARNTYRDGTKRRPSFVTCS